jgi:hypothetical protein
MMPTVKARALFTAAAYRSLRGFQGVVPLAVQRNRKITDRCTMKFTVVATPWAITKAIT